MLSKSARAIGRRINSTLLCASVALTALPFTASAQQTVLVNAVLPSTRSVDVGATATAFMTVINGGSVTGTACSIAPATTVPATFFYQTTDPATNGLTGTPNTPVNIPAGAAQSFVIAFTPTAALAPTNVAFRVVCANAPAATSFPGLNTLLLSASITATPDMVALAATVSGDGTVHMPSNVGASFFAVAFANVGGAGTITASVDLGGAQLPVSARICQTNPVTGVCISPLGRTVTTSVAAGATGSFALFMSATGRVAFKPAASRVFVRLRDTTGATRGSTSVAIVTDNPGPVPSFGELSTVAYSTLTPTSTPPSDSGAFPAYVFQRYLGAGNICGNDRNDLLFAPGYFSSLPTLPLHIWCNLGDGRFEDRTGSVLATPVTAESVNNVFVADLNGDGIDDIFIVDQGLELPTGFLGARNKLILSGGPGGKHVDASGTLPVAYNAFNHVSAMADINGDGCPDFLITALGGPNFTHEGSYFLINNCKGQFAKSIAGIPLEIAERLSSAPLEPGVDYRGIYGAQAADIDGDGAIDIIAAGPSVTNGSGPHSIRIYRGGNGFTEAARLPIPTEIAAAILGNTGGTGFTHYAFGDFTGSGRVDVAAHVETQSTTRKTYMIVFKNLGNFTFEDVTLQLAGSYETSFLDSGFIAANNGGVRPINLSISSSPLSDIAKGCFNIRIEPIVEGHCMLRNVGGQSLAKSGFTKNGMAATVADVLAVAPLDTWACNSLRSIPVAVDVFGTGVPDWVLVSACRTGNSLIDNKLQIITLRSGVRP